MTSRQQDRDRLWESTATHAPTQPALMVCPRCKTAEELAASTVKEAMIAIDAFKISHTACEAKP